MTEPEGVAAGANDATRRLATALVDSATLVRAVPERLRVAPAEGVPPGSVPALQRLLNRLTDALELPRLDVVPQPARPWSVEIALSRRLALGSGGYDAVAGGARPGPGASGDVEGVARSASAALPGRPVMVPAYDGTPLRCFTAGREDRPAVALVTACGMPVGLVARWMAALSGSYRVVTWESRGMFPTGTGPSALADHGLAAQAGDLLAVLDGFGIRRAHIMGLCGGAAIALAAASGSARVMSMSLWHGDYELGAAAPKTDHQRDVGSLLARASRNLEQAAGLHRLMRRPSALNGMRPDLAHHLIHPYATPGLLHRYGLLNGAIMSTDCRPFLAAGQPALVVSSPQDTTAHPAGSEYVATRLTRADLRMLPDGDHLGAFDAGPELVRLAEEFLHDVSAPHRKDT
ncbi:alpha/beta hydrolase [Streptomyces sp. NRRL B-1140]|uniref:alpha/beta fold hydrolase n=1 Tax=Streptomyces sp. NRRL B-1140 TaxID=1415549 RepID=UPI0006AFA0C0|nr:alpha/beta hydrolase [Streptomyces sp. NRRL B-1140]KOX04368.1 alpha/beta hydrolase [Streptomyces sp. NRRL B-1140]